MQYMNRPWFVVLIILEVLKSSWEYRNELKETLTLPVPLLVGRQNNIWFSKWRVPFGHFLRANWKGYD